MSVREQLYHQCHHAETKTPCLLSIISMGYPVFSLRSALLNCKTARFTVTAIICPPKAHRIPHHVEEYYINTAAHIPNYCNCLFCRLWVRSQEKCMVISLVENNEGARGAGPLKSDTTQAVNLQTMFHTFLRQLLMVLKCKPGSEVFIKMFICLWINQEYGGLKLLGRLGGNGKWLLCAGVFIRNIHILYACTQT